MISKEEVKHIAKLARLGLDDKETERFQKELSAVLSYVEKLKEVDISKAESADHAITIENVSRKDEAKPLGNKNLLDSAPDKKDGFLKVKSVF
ncbi:MAG: Asp-tRNA(Asn)/Glu-tRNA(Gln) amidotransferase subunit GatC [Parcubacteria group bacterium]